MALQNLRSSTPSKRPDASSMSDGQIALNTAAASAGLFFKDSNGDLVKTGPVHIGTTAPNSTPATGGSTGNSKGEAWLDTSNGNYVLKIYDGTSWQSVEIAPGSARQLLQTNAAGTDVEFTSNVDVPGTLDVTGATTLDSTASVAGLLSANGKISFAAGNSAAPGIYPGSDTDTGISSPSLNELSFSTAGTSRLYIDSSGEIGVGTTTPGYALDVQSGDARFKRSASNAAAIYFGNSSNNYIYGDSDLNLLAFATNGSEKLRIDSAGNVGIGASSPTNKLSVVSTTGSVGADITASGNAYLILDSSVGDTSGNQISFIDFKDNGVLQANISVNEATSGQPLELNSATSNNVVLAAGGGNVGIGTLSPVADLDVLSTSGRFFVRTDQSDLCLDSVNTANSAFDDLRLRANAIRFQNGGTERMVIDSAGRVGIGAPTPSYYDSTADNLVVGESGDIGITIASGNSSRGTLMFADGQSGLAQYAGYIQYNHNGDYLAIASNNSEAMRINSSGNVGIGTSTINAKLDIIGDANDSILPNNAIFKFKTGGGNGLYMGTRSSSPYQSYIQSGFHNNNNNSIPYSLLLNPEGGNVGIGTSSPNNLLDVRGSSNPQLKVSATNTGTNSAGLYIENQGQRNWQIWADRSSDQLRIGHNSRASTVVSVTDTRVGINATSPVSPLTVLGINSGGEGGALCLQNTATGVNTNVSLYLCPNNGGGNDLQRSAAIKSRQEVAGNYANLEFYTSQSNAPTERMRIDVSGRLLIGTPTTLDTSYQTAGGNLQVVNAALPVILGDYNNHQYGPRLDFVKTRAGVTNGKTIVAHNDQLGNIIWGGADGTNIIPAATITANVDGTPGTNDMPGRLVFLTTADGAAAPAERMRITQAGRVGIATSNPGAYLHVNSGGQATSSLNTGGDLSLIVSDGGTAVNNGGSIVFAAASGSWRFAAIKGLVTDGANNARGDIAVCTRGSSTDSTLTERARISREGHFYIHTTSIFPGSGNTATGAMFEKAGDGTTSFVSRDNNVAGYFNRNSDGNLIRYMRSGNEVGRISITSSNTSYLTTSDYRLKENVVNISDGITRVKQLAPKRFNFIADADTTVDGFLAHEAQAVVPEAVHGAHNEVDDEGNPVMQGIDQSKLVPLLTAALQEAIAKIETLEQRLNDAGL